MFSDLSSPHRVRKRSEDAQRLPTFREDIRAGQRLTATNVQRLSPERAYKETKKS
jgi:hypothetical protein